MFNLRERGIMKLEFFFHSYLNIYNTSLTQFLDVQIVYSGVPGLTFIFTNFDKLFIRAINLIIFYILFFSFKSLNQLYFLPSMKQYQNVYFYIVLIETLYLESLNYVSLILIVDVIANLIKKIMILKSNDIILG